MTRILDIVEVIRLKRNANKTSLERIVSKKSGNPPMIIAMMALPIKRITRSVIITEKRENQSLPICVFDRLFDDLIAVSFPDGSCIVCCKEAVEGFCSLFISRAG